MRELEGAYGRKAYLAWEQSGRRSLDLSREKSSTEEAAADIYIWPIDTFEQLVSDVAFLTVMNKRAVLLFRGQSSDVRLLPSLCRSRWNLLRLGHWYSITAANRQAYFETLQEVGKLLFQFCKKDEFGLPRWRGMRSTPAIQWAVAQHYSVWPTPLLDLTSSLRVAASFALGLCRSTQGSERTGFLYVFAFPASGETDGPILVSREEHLLLARLQACCPPSAIRAHLQDGYLVGDRELADSPRAFSQRSAAKRDDRYIDKSDLRRRLVAKFKLRDNGNNGGFWNDAHPVMTEASLLPSDDPFAVTLKNELASRLAQMAKDVPGAV